MIANEPKVERPLRCYLSDIFFLCGVLWRISEIPQVAVCFQDVAWCSPFSLQHFACLQWMLGWGPIVLILNFSHQQVLQRHAGTKRCSLCFVQNVLAFPERTTHAAQAVSFAPWCFSALTHPTRCRYNAVMPEACKETGRYTVPNSWLIQIKRQRKLQPAPCDLTKPL